MRCVVNCIQKRYITSAHVTCDRCRSFLPFNHTTSLIVEFERSNKAQCLRESAHVRSRHGANGLGRTPLMM
ncbi:hypothetical protein RSAG8_12266, partial [Rhizoctonia solani AG-8 WAC10335]